MDNFQEKIDSCKFIVDNMEKVREAQLLIKQFEYHKERAINLMLECNRDFLDMGGVGAGPFLCLTPNKGYDLVIQTEKPES